MSGDNMVKHLIKLGGGYVTVGPEGYSPFRFKPAHIIVTAYSVYMFPCPVGNGPVVNKPGSARNRVDVERPYQIERQLLTVYRP
jgi:hypothetical protein